jgi:hypothetical protein
VDATKNETEPDGPDDDSKSFDDDAEESEDEVSALTVQGQRQAFVTGADWTTATLLDQLRRGNIELNPRFQRREVWRPDRKSRFIESVVLNLPIPQIVLAESKTERNKFIVLDGKQRLLTLRQFCADPVAHPEDVEYRTLELVKLSAYPDLNGSTYAKFVANPARVEDRNAFDNHTIRTVVVRNWPDEDYLYRVFLRLNSNTVPLSPQELRQALKPGGFTEFLDERATDSAALRAALRQAGPDFRMRDNELMLRGLAFKLRSNTYAGNLKRFLDDAFDEFNEKWSSVDVEVTEATDQFEFATVAVLEIFKDRAFSRFRKGRGYDRRFNRAIFDIYVYALSFEETRELALSHAGEVVEAFEELCSTDSEFIDSVTSTTKSPRNTGYRFSALTRSLTATLGVQVRPPEGLDLRLP